MVQHDFALAVSEMNVFDHCHRHYGLLFLLRIAVAKEKPEKCALRWDTMEPTT